MRQDLTERDLAALADEVKQWGQALGFQQVAITDVDLDDYADDFKTWLAQGFHGSMAYMTRNQDARLNPAALIPGTVRVISARMDYLPPDTEPLRILGDATRGYVSRYAVGRDYHKVVRRRLVKLVDHINAAVAGSAFRAFADSAPVLEKPLAEKAGLGWVGKHSLVLNRQAGSWFFLGEVFTNLPLPVDAPTTDSHCGRCSACISVCPTGAIVGPKQLDARRCISYLTIENKGPIPAELRSAMGNRIFGCDDCQLVCPWNRYARNSAEADFQPRHRLDGASLLALFAWTEAEFLTRTEGMALRRINYQQWQRNLSVALGNAPYDAAIVAALQARRPQVEPWVAEHFDWAIAQQQQRGAP